MNVNSNNNFPDKFPERKEPQAQMVYGIYIPKDQPDSYAPREQMLYGILMPEQVQTPKKENIFDKLKKLLHIGKKD